jgi:peptidyl-prolyl cis-trans isomerase C
MDSNPSLPRVNGVPLTAPDEDLPAESLRQRAHQELLRQRAMALGLLSPDDPVPVGGVCSEAASLAIEGALAHDLVQPDPDEATCRRWHAANATRFARGERLRVRHILFAVTPGVDITRLRARAEACLVDVRSRSREEIEADAAGSAADRFAAAASQLSNCPSGSEGGDLGWLTAADCAPEFARPLFGQQDLGVLPRLVHSRFGLHVVEVLAREPGLVPPYEQVQAAVRATLQRQALATALRQHLQRLAGDAAVEGVVLDAADSPLLQ